MTPEERNLITGLFDRLGKANANAPAKDREAEELIRQLSTQNPSAAYLLTQTTLVQEHALTNAQARIQTLEKQLAQAQQQQPQPASSGSSGGFLSNLFGGGSSSTPPPPPPQQQQAPPPVQPQAPPYPSTVGMAPSAGGGFLRNALGTAAGVAGGAMLFQGIQNLLGHNSGPFGALGNSGGSFLGGGGPREVVNNYYGDSTGERQHEGSGVGGSGGGDNNETEFTGSSELGEAIPQGVADQPANPGYEDSRYEGNNFDTSNPFDKPMDDQSFLGARDESSLDNNYDTDNTDAGGSDFGGDFVGGDNDGGGGDDSSYV